MDQCYIPFVVINKYRHVAWECVGDNGIGDGIFFEVIFEYSELLCEGVDEFRVGWNSECCVVGLKIAEL